MKLNEIANNDIERKIEHLNEVLRVTVCRSQDGDYSISNFSVAEENGKIYVDVKRDRFSTNVVTSAYMERVRSRCSFPFILRKVDYFEVDNVWFNLLPEQVMVALHIDHNIHTLHNIYKHVKLIKERINLFVTGGRIPESLLAILLIKGKFDLLIYSEGDGSTTAQRCRQVENIITRHLKTRDINACQEELIDAGFERQARL